MLAEGKGPINFTVFLALFGEKLNGMYKTANFRLNTQRELHLKVVLM